MKDDRLYLQHALDAIDRVLSYTTAGRDSFRSDMRTQDAVIRNLEIIGEAVKNVSSATRDAHSDVEWRRIAGMRDKLIHEYFGVNLELVWEVVEKDLPPQFPRVTTSTRTHRRREPAGLRALLRVAGAQGAGYRTAPEGHSGHRGSRGERLAWPVPPGAGASA